MTDTWFDDRFGHLPQAAAEAMRQTIESTLPPIRKENTMTKQIEDLKPQDTLRIKAFKMDGRTPRDVSKAFGITPSAASAIYEAIDNPMPKASHAPTATPSEPLTGLRPQVLESARDVAIGANVAEAKLAAGKGDTLTLNELSSLAGVLFSG
jgi:hypothetical protein